MLGGIYPFNYVVDHFGFKTVTIPANSSDTVTIRNSLVVLRPDARYFNGTKVFAVGLYGKTDISDAEWNSNITFSYSAGVLTISNQTSNTVNIGLCLIG